MKEFLERIARAGKLASAGLMAALRPLAATAKYYLDPGNPSGSITSVATLMSLRQPTEWQRQHQLEIIAALQWVVDHAPTDLPDRAKDAT